MEKSIKRITKVIIIVLSAIVILTGISVMVTGNKIVLDISLSITYIMAFIAVILILAFAILQITSNPKQLIRALILLAVNAVIFLFFYLISPDVMSDVAKRIGLTITAYKLVWASVHYTGVILAGVFVSLIGSLIYINVKN
jgi:hypothetical protein